MSDLEPLAACAGSWKGDSTLQDPMTGTAETSASTATLTSAAGGRFVRLDYTWSYQGAPQDGSLLVGFDPPTAALSGHWIDSWHMGRKVMACTGPAPAGGPLLLTGSFAAPTGPDWGWRIELAPGPDALRITMVNISPEGEESPAVEAAYTRA